MCTEQNVTVGVPESEGSRSRPWDHTPRTFACGVFLEQDGEVCVASVRSELIGDVENVITGFL